MYKRTRSKFNFGGAMETNEFMYMDVVTHHFLYRHQVHDKNNRRHPPISVERTWATKYWPDRCFAWYLAVSEVNVNYARAYFQYSSNALSHIEFRRRLANDLLEIPLVDRGTGGSGVGLRSRMELHELITKPPFTGKWISNTRRWHKVKGQYQQSRCTKCSKQTLTCCKFSRGRKVPHNQSLNSMIQFIDFLVLL